MILKVKLFSVCGVAPISSSVILCDFLSYKFSGTMDKGLCCEEEFSVSVARLCPRSSLLAIAVLDDS